jgi:hypothetical protein
LRFAVILEASGLQPIDRLVPAEPRGERRVTTGTTALRVHAEQRRPIFDLRAAGVDSYERKPHIVSRFVGSGFITSVEP